MSKRVYKNFLFIRKSDNDWVLVYNTPIGDAVLQMGTLAEVSATYERYFELPNNELELIVEPWRK